MRLRATGLNSILNYPSTLLYNIAYFFSEGNADIPESSVVDPQTLGSIMSSAPSLHISSMEHLSSPTPSMANPSTHTHTHTHTNTNPSANTTSTSINIPQSNNNISFLPMEPSNTSVTSTSTSTSTSASASTAAVDGPTNFASIDPNATVIRFRVNTAPVVKTSRIWFIKDPLGMTTAIMTHILVLYAAFVTYYALLRPRESDFEFLLLVLFWSFSGLALWSHMRAMLTNPGSIPLGSPHFVMEKIERSKPVEINGEQVTNCVKCNNYKPLRAHHCSVCGRCIRKMDHHCPWVNNCVGEHNQKYFIQFVMYIVLVSCLELIIIIYRVVDCANNKWETCKDWNASGGTIALVASVGFEACLFGLFTVIMLFDQMCNINENETGIERLMKQGGRLNERFVPKKKTSILQSLTQICGTSFGYRWFLPLRKPQPHLHSHRPGVKHPRFQNV